MRLLKKLLRIIAIILPVFAAVLLPKMASAASYTVDKVPFSVVSGLQSLEFRLRYNSDATLTTKDLYYIYMKYEDGKCKYNNYHNALSYDNSGLSYYLPTYSPLLLDAYSNISLARCNLSSPDYGNQINDTAPQYAFGTPNFREWKGYRFQYDGMYLTDCDPDLATACSTFTMSDLIKPVPEEWKEIILPLGMPGTNVEDMIVNTPIRFSGTFWFDSSTGSFNNFLFSPGTFRLRIDGYESQSDLENQHKHTQFIPCTYVSSVGTGDTAGIQYIDFVCSGVSNVTYYNNLYYLTLHLVGNGGPSQDLLIRAIDVSQFVLSDFNLTLNNDITPGGRFTDSVVGGETQNAPNSIKSPENHPGDGGAGYQDSWEYKLSHLFNFDMLNPFQQVFNMFSDSSACHHIPIVAGMLNVADDEYCPWFPATVRQILTPVVSISATMLLFGFFVRFLKSSSGNDTIDTGGRNLEVHK